jgi:tRNA G37 N-methylase Trm5
MTYKTNRPASLSDIIYIHYRVGVDSLVMKTINECRDQHARFLAAAKVFQTEHKARAVIIEERSRLCGLEFDGEAPEGWRTKTGEAWCVPDANTKTGRAIKREITALPEGYNPARFSDMLGPEYTHDDDRHTAWSSFSIYNDVVILSVPAACRAKPEGCIELKMSEFYRITEEDN